MGVRILVIKLAATGDVLRTTPLLPALKRQLPAVPRDLGDAARSAGTARRARGDRPRCWRSTPTRSRGFRPSASTSSICLDKEPAATGLARSIARAGQARLRARPTRQPAARPTPDADYAYRLGLDDALKFHENQRSYQQIAFEAAGLAVGRRRLPNRAARGGARAWRASAGWRCGLEPAIGRSSVSTSALATSTPTRPGAIGRLGGAARVWRRSGSARGGAARRTARPRARRGGRALAAAPRRSIPAPRRRSWSSRALLERCAAVVSGDTLAHAPRAGARPPRGRDLRLDVSAGGRALRARRAHRPADRLPPLLQAPLRPTPHLRRLRSRPRRSSPRSSACWRRPLEARGGRADLRRERERRPPARGDRASSRIPGLEAIVVDDASPDGTAERVR